jgi:hypothetical protein
MPPALSNLTVSATKIRIIEKKQRPILTQLGNGHQNLHESHQYRMYSTELLMMGRDDARNMQSFITE